MYRYFKRVVNSEYILSWKSKGLSDESITPPSAPHYFLNPSLYYLGTTTRVRFSGSCLKQDTIRYNHGKIANIHIVYEINKNDNTTSSDPTLENCSFGAVSLTKNADINKYKYSGYWDWISLVLTFFISCYWIRQKCNNFCSRYEFINKD